uniref:Shugoshin C-terminal domain-containing protein n=2 Tax=Dendroctonus ponderosae TaxID=77166 RepID=A0AAR5P9Y7_DENPD
MSALTYAAETSKTTRKKNTAHLPVVDDVQLVSHKPQRRKRSHDLTEQKDTLPADSNEDPPINEGASTSKDVPSGTARKGQSKADSHISTYSMSRRLTRRQASMLESMSVEDEIGNMPIMEEIDPVQLLDKPEFKGKQDPDEAKVYERSPSTGSETSRQTRASSVLSQHLVGVTTAKPTRAEKASTSGVKSKKTPIDFAAPKRSDDMAELEQNTLKKAGLRTRSRTNSVSSIQSDNSDVSDSSARTTRSRSSRIAKTQLPEISEEKMVEDVPLSTAKPAKKVGRKKK